MLKEEWKAVVGFEGSHVVSSLGRIFSIPRTVEFSDGRVRKYPGVEMAQYEDWFGYKKVTLSTQLGKTRVHVHVLVAAAFIGPMPSHLAHVCHNNGDCRDNAASNLRYDTVRGNHADKKKHGTHLHSERAPNTSLSRETVLAIRAARGSGTCTELAAKFGTSRANICNIQLGRRWIYVREGIAKKFLTN